MKNLIKVVAFFLFVFMSTSLVSQEKTTDLGLVIHFDLGWTFLGPIDQMYSHMIEEGFDQTTENWFYNSSIEHPRTNIPAPSIGWGLSIPISTKSNLGLSFQFNHLREISGASQDYDILFISFNSYQIIPSYGRKIGETIDFKIGVPLMANSAKKTSRSGRDNNYTEPSIGLLLGINLKLFEGGGIYGKIGMDAVITYNNGIGPFTAGASDNSVLSQSDVNFSHLNLKYIMGIKTR